MLVLSQSNQKNICHLQRWKLKWIYFAKQHKVFKSWPVRWWHAPCFLGTVSYRLAEMLWQPQNQCQLLSGHYDDYTLNILINTSKVPALVWLYYTTCIYNSTWCDLLCYLGGTLEWHSQSSLSLYLSPSVCLYSGHFFLHNSSFINQHHTSRKGWGKTLESCWDIQYRKRLHREDFSAVWVLVWGHVMSCHGAMYVH